MDFRMPEEKGETHLCGLLYSIMGERTEMAVSGPSHRTSHGNNILFQSQIRIKN